MKLNDLQFKIVCRIKNILRKTTAKMFKNCRIGDLIEFEIPLKPIGRTVRGSYSAVIKITNLRTREFTTITLNKSYWYNDIFELEQEDDSKTRLDELNRLKKCVLDQDKYTCITNDVLLKLIEELELKVECKD